MNDPRRLYDAHREEIEAAIIETMRSGWWLNGPRCKKFSEDFSDYLGVANVIPVANGTDALEISLRAILGHRSPDNFEVITVANAGGYTTTACRQLNLIPTYADIEPANHLLSIDSVIRALNENTLAVVATHLYGNPVDVSALILAMQSAGYGHIPVIEDCAQSHGASIKGQMTGAIGKISTFSFYPTKNLGALGDAGAIVTSDADLAAIARSLQQYGWRDKYDIARHGARNSRMDEIQAAALSTMLPYLEAHNNERRKILEYYESSARSKIRFIQRSEGSIIHLAVVVCDDRKGLREHFTQNGISSDVHYPISDPDQRGWADSPYRLSAGGIEHSRQAAKSILSIPCFAGMEDYEIERVSKAISSWERN